MEGVSSGSFPSTGWGRSDLWFIKFMHPFVRYLREKLGYRVLPCVDDFLLATSHVVTPRRKTWSKPLMHRLGITNHETKGYWQGDKTLNTLGPPRHYCNARIRATQENTACAKTCADDPAVSPTQPSSGVCRITSHVLRCGRSVESRAPLSTFLHTIAFPRSVASRVPLGRHPASTSILRARSTHPASPQGSVILPDPQPGGRGATSRLHLSIFRYTPTRRMLDAVELSDRI